MNKLYREFFYVPKYGKVREKVMLARAAMTIVSVVVCLFAMSITAYAYFSYNATSDSNIIKTANFEADVSISITENDSSTAVAVTKEKNASYAAVLKAGKTYTVTLDESDNSTASTGFCVVSAVGCPDIYRSQQIGADTAAEGDFTDKVTFQLKVTADTTVTFLSHWGTSSYYPAYAEKGENNRLYITNDSVDENKVVMMINGISEADCDAKEESETETPTINSVQSPTTLTTETTQPTETTTSETTGTSEPTSITEPSVSKTETTATQLTETTTSETTGISEPTSITEPSASKTETTATQPTETTGAEETEQTQPTTGATETTGAPTTKASE